MEDNAVVQDTELADIAAGRVSANRVEEVGGTADTVRMLAVDIVALENRDLDSQFEDRTLRVKAHAEDYGLEAA